MKYQFIVPFFGFFFSTLLILAQKENNLKSLYPLPSYQSSFEKGLNFSIKASVAFGSNGVGLGINSELNFGGKIGSLSVGLGTTYYYISPNTKINAFETRLSCGSSVIFAKDARLAYYHTKFWSGKTSQRVGNVITSYKDWSMNYENDFMGDGGDRYRTHATILSFRDYSIGLNMFTGNPGLSKYIRRINDDIGKFGTYILGTEGDNPDGYRTGILYFGFKEFRLGFKSDKIRHLFQNLLIHDNTKSPQFAVIDRRWYLYGGMYSLNNFTSW
jgi:hypothetical protein